MISVYIYQSMIIQHGISYKKNLILRTMIRDNDSESIMVLFIWLYIYVCNINLDCSSSCKRGDPSIEYQRSDAEWIQFQTYSNPRITDSSTYVSEQPNWNAAKSTELINI